MLCPKCGLVAFGGIPVSDCWVVCVATERAGETVHESFSFGPGSPWSEGDAEVQARAWAGVTRGHRYPQGRVLGIYRCPAEATVGSGGPPR